MKTLSPKTQKKRKGRPLEFSDQLILLLLMIKIHYKRPYRILEGFSRFFFEQFKNVIGDAAYDDRDVREWIRKQGGKSLIPPPSNGICHGTDLERDEAIQVIRAFGGDKIAKSIWGSYLVT